MVIERQVFLNIMTIEMCSPEQQAPAPLDGGTFL